MRLSNLDNDDGDDGHELEELDLGCFISPGSLFQLAASHHCVFLIFLTWLHPIVLTWRPGDSDWNNSAFIACSHSYLGGPYLCGPTYIVPFSLLTSWLKYFWLNMTPVSPHGLYRSYLKFRGQICICLHRNFLQRQQDPGLFIPPPVIDSAKAQCQINFAYDLKFLIE